MQARAWMNASGAKRLASLVLALALAAAALLLLGGWVGGAAAAGNLSAPLLPAVTIVVTTTVDSPDNNTSDGQCHDQVNGGCSLRAAIQQLDHDSGGTITLPAGTYILTDTAGDLQLQKDITLNGAGPASTLIQGNPSGWAHRILRVQDGADAVIVGATISGGHPVGLGGGIDVITSTLLLSNSVVSNNSAGNGGGVYNTGALTVENSIIRSNQAITSGGGIYSDSNDPAGPGGHLLIDHSQVLSNAAQAGLGGGIFYNDTNPAAGYLYLQVSIVSGNQALSGGGGGLAQNLGNAVVSGSDIRLNQSVDGGGIVVVAGGALLVTTSTIETNTATISTGQGGGIWISQSALRLVTDTVRGNQADYYGGGLYSANTRLDVAGTRFISNTATNFAGGALVSQQDIGFFTNTVFSQNQAPAVGGAGGAVAALGSAFTFTLSTFDHNLADAGAGLVGEGPTAQLALISSTVNANRSHTYGGGLVTSLRATLTLTGTDVTSNTAGTKGGGLYLLGGPNAISSISGGHISGNIAQGGSAGQDGGGLYNQTHLTINGAVISANQALIGQGGGLFNLGFAALNGSSASHNSASGGGGLANVLSGTLNIIGSTLSDNTATVGLGGGLSNSGASASAYIVNSTISGNQAPNSGGGLANQGGMLDLSNVTVAGNTTSAGDGGGLYTAVTATTRLRNSIVALNLDTGAQAPDCAGTYQSDGYNLVQSLAGCGLANNTTGDVIGSDPRLWPLGQFGGPTLTRAPMPGSPVLEAGNVTGCRDSVTNLLTVDQRGSLRPAGSRCDIGAVEGTFARSLWLPLMRR